MRYAFNEAMEICERAIRTFPDAYGSQLCKTLIQQIEQKSVSASVESISLPGEELLAQLEYRNLSSLYLKIVKLPESPKRWRGDTWDGEEVLRKLNQLSSRKDWKQTFDSGNDHQQHNTETVSYTHLDVYKRQALNSATNTFDLRLEGCNKVSACAAANCLTGEEIICFIPRPPGLSGAVTTPTIG